MATKTAAVLRAELNRLSPTAREVMLGNLLAELIDQHNALVADVTQIRTRHNGAMAKLDADAGVTDTNYATLQNVPALTAVTVGDLAAR